MKHFATFFGCKKLSHAQPARTVVMVHLLLLLPPQYYLPFRQSEHLSLANNGSSCLKRSADMKRDREQCPGKAVRNR